MSTKVIQFKDDNNVLLPVSDAGLIQISVDGTTKSVKDVILENEEIVAEALSYLNGQLEDITDIVENLSDSDEKVGFIPTTTNTNYPLIFKESTDNTTVPNKVRFDWVLGAAYYNPSTHTMYVKNINTSNLKINGSDVSSLTSSLSYETIYSNMTGLSLF